MTEIARTVPTALAALRQRQIAAELTSEIEATSREVTTGLRSDPWDSLGARSSDALAIRAQLERNDNFLVQNRVLDGRLEQIESSLGSIREAGQEVMDIAAFSVNRPEATARSLSTIAKAAIATITNVSAIRHNGSYALSGTATNQVPLNPWDDVSPTSGVTPRSVLEDITGGAIGDAADAQAKIDALKAAFDGTSATAAHNFQNTFYNGTPQQDAAGNANPKLSYRLSETETLSQPLQADDPAMRNLMRGLAMVSAVDVTEITDPDAYAAWMKEATSALSDGLAGVAQLQVETGLRRDRVVDVADAQETRSSFLQRERQNIEGVDQYDAASRLTLLQSQLEANYAVTARLSRLSFLNFL
ncbi:flagellar hook-associated protein 3 FlgL [Palleronia salina]|uniref:Flagellar hook-associated protein 3 FlgL n=1 Tax=Palleronia salina TaxID=313368 RepID=A0A1M6CZJ7_9RHOB|nr:flagellin [Palleronia salina]SHI66291.1 flagellar hook-associated protein 3 FlgL [Palleronia salina]